MEGKVQDRGADAGKDNCRRSIRGWGVGTRPDGRTSVGVGVLLADLREDFKSVIS